MSDYNTEPIRVKWGIDTGFFGATHEDVWEFGPGEVPVEPAARTEFFEECLREEISNHINAYYEVEDAEVAA